MAKISSYAHTARRLVGRGQDVHARTRRSHRNEEARTLGYDRRYAHKLMSHTEA